MISLKPLLRLVFIALLCACTVHLAQAQQTDAQPRRWWHKFRPDSVQKWNFKFIPVPTVSSSPETGFKVGVAINYFFNAADKDSTKGKSRDSYVYADLQYSTRRQLFTELYGQVYTPGERYFLRGRIGYVDNYERIWGFGNFSLPNNGFQEVNYSRWYLQGSALRQLRKQLFLGVRTNVSTLASLTTTFKDSNLIAQKPGSQSSVVVGLGPTLIWDRRDHPLGPEKGFYAELALTVHERWLGGQFAYTETLVDLRRYLSQGRHTLAFQGFGQWNAGTLPWREIPRMGNPTIMRGYFNGRFRGNAYLAAQAEYRIRAHRWFGFALFGAAGQVQDELGLASLADTRLAAGAGLRLYASQKKRITLRLDYARTTDNTSGFYVKIGEAF